MNDGNGNKTVNDDAINTSYMFLRTFIGVLAIALPIILSIGASVIFDLGIQSSISRYYHTGMRDVFVGTLFAIGFFLSSYKGYKDGPDNIVGMMACVFAVGLALFPTTPDNPVSSNARVIGYIHFAFTFLFFATLIYFSLVLFRRTHIGEEPKGKKIIRNNVYLTCGLIMTICIFLIGIYSYILPKDLKLVLTAYNPVYWLESAAIWAFGISWFVKGEPLGILKDED